MELRHWLSAGAIVFGISMPAHAQEFTAEDQTPTGKFLTASEVKPILSATKANWIAVREWEGQDLLYVTQLLSWRCGLHELRYRVNGEEALVWPLPPCDAASYTPGAIPEEAQIYIQLPLSSVETVQIDLLYDDLTTEQGVFERSSILIP